MHRLGQADYQREGGGGGGTKGAKYRVTEDDLTLGGVHTMQIQIGCHRIVHLKSV